MSEHHQIRAHVPNIGCKLEFHVAFTLSDIAHQSGTGEIVAKYLEQPASEAQDSGDLFGSGLYIFFTPVLRRLD